MTKKDRKETAIKALQESDEFYLLTIKGDSKAGYWNFNDYTKLIGCLIVAVDWLKREVLKTLS